MKMLLKIILILLLLLVIYLGSVILVGELTFYKPKDVEIISKNENAKPINQTSFSALIWNIGFAGLGAQSDFFYDGGEMTRSSKELNKKYWQGIQSYIAEQSNVDFLLLQEVDVNSKRSRGINQVKYIETTYGYNTTDFSTNYKVNYVPLKFTDPLGEVHSGVMSCSNFEPITTKRYQLPGSYSWPNKLFFLRRCFMAQRYQLANGENELVIINAHFSAYDDGTLKQEEMQALKSFVVTEYERGNYVVVGADWNQEPTSKEITSFLPDWNFAFDPETPTNRSLEAPLNEKTTKKVIDYYLVSPNVKVKEVKAVEMNFEFSDHQPVRLNFELND